MSRIVIDKKVVKQELSADVDARPVLASPAVVDRIPEVYSYESLRIDWGKEQDDYPTVSWEAKSG